MDEEEERGLIPRAPRLALGESFELLSDVLRDSQVDRTLHAPKRLSPSEQVIRRGMRWECADYSIGQGKP